MRWLLALLLCSLACTTPFWQARFDGVPVDPSAPFLKCHTRAGDVYVLASWQADAAARKVSGTGLHYDSSRNVVGRGGFTLAFDDVVVFETNRPETVVQTGAIVMGVLTGASVALSSLCLAVPKACFGSCPTFYASDGEAQVLQAEGFSDAIAPSLEKVDVDALYLAKPAAGGATFDLRMTNEALETHVVNSVRVLAVPRPSGGRVFHARGAFHAARAVTAPTSCRAPSGACLAAVRTADDVEYRSLTDEHDLAAREIVELVFARPPPSASGGLGVVVRGRNTLLNTYLFYQTLAYAGLDAGDWLMRLERGGEQAREMFGGQGKLLGDVDVTVLVDGEWLPAGTFSEVGPIAKEVQLVTLPERAARGAGELRVRLTMTQGNWRIDQVALAELAGVVTPKALEPVRVTRAGVEDAAALANLADPKRYLVTYPGDDYTISFDAPPADSELFLASGGYYLEWVRKEWLFEQDSGRVAEMFLAPGATLKRLAPAFKKLEPSMEEVFWKSGYAP